MGSHDPFLSMQEGNNSGCAPRPALVLKGKLGPGNEPGGSESCLFQGWNLQQNFMASEKKILSVYKQEGMSLRSWRS